MKTWDLLSMFIQYIKNSFLKYLIVEWHLTCGNQEAKIGNFILLLNSGSHVAYVPILTLVLLRNSSSNDWQGKNSQWNTVLSVWWFAHSQEWNSNYFFEERNKCQVLLRDRICLSCTLVDSMPPFTSTAEIVAALYLKNAKMVTPEHFFFLKKKKLRW